MPLEASVTVDYENKGSVASHDARSSKREFAISTDNHIMILTIKVYTHFMWVTQRFDSQTRRDRVAKNNSALIFINSMSPWRAFISDNLLHIYLCLITLFLHRNSLSFFVNLLRHYLRRSTMFLFYFFFVSPYSISLGTSTLFSPSHQQDFPPRTFRPRLSRRRRLRLTNQPA